MIRGLDKRVHYTPPLHTARLDFYEQFVRHANRNTSRSDWTKGQWAKDETQETLGQLGRCLGVENVFGASWLRWLPDHLKGNEIHGVFGAETSSYLLIDLDLHKSSLDLFLRRLRVLLDVFHGKYGCHFQVSNENAGGVHIILFFGKQGLVTIRRKWITNILLELDREHPGVNFTTSNNHRIKLNVEVFPNKSFGHRLPLCHGRTMLLDKPKPLVSRGKKQVYDVVGYMNWLADRNRQYMDKDEVYRFVVERLSQEQAAKEPRREKTFNRGERDTDLYMSPTFSGATENAPEKPPKSLKGKLRGALVGYWQRGEGEHFPNLNTAIAVTLRAMYFERLSQDEAVALVSQYVDDLPNKSLSSRLADNRPDIDRVIENDARTIWDGNGGQGKRRSKPARSSG